MAKSLPSRERGLKYENKDELDSMLSVAPLAGAWIEIIFNALAKSLNASLPSRERGLK